MVISPDGKRERIEVPAEIAATLESKVIDFSSANARSSSELCYYGGTGDVKVTNHSTSTAIIFCDHGEFYLPAGASRDVCLSDKPTCDASGYTCYIQNMSSAVVEVEDLGTNPDLDIDEGNIPSYNYVIYSYVD